jgi:hypothetical protein
VTGRLLAVAMHMALRMANALSERIILVIFISFIITGVR